MSLVNSRYYRAPETISSQSHQRQELESREGANAFEITDSETIKVIIGLFLNQPLPTLSAEELEDVEDMKNITKCSHCGQDFSLWENAGLRGCRTHPGQFKHEIWECCNVTSEPLKVGASLSRRAKIHCTDSTASSENEVIRHEPHGLIKGCVDADHLLSGEEHTLTPHQIDRVHNLLVNFQPEKSRAQLIGDLTIPLRRSREASVELPLLIFLYMPSCHKRAIQKLTYRPNSEPNSQHDIEIQLTPTFSVNLAHLWVCISRVSA